MIELENLTKCVSCGCENHDIVFNAIIDMSRIESGDFKVSDKQYGSSGQILRCGNCGLHFVSPRPTSENLAALYTQMEDGTYLDGFEERVRIYGRYLQQIQAMSSASKILDIGSGSGVLIQAALSGNFERIYGIEPSSWLVKNSPVDIDNNRVKVFVGTFPETRPSCLVDCVTIMDVIEHVPNPKIFLEEIHHQLIPKGIVLLSTPDISSFTARVMGRKWWHFRPSHIFYFSKETIQDLLERVGFEILKVEYYTWNFSLKYVLSRLEAYAVFSRFASALTRLLSKMLGDEILKKQIKVNFRDSIVVFARKRNI